MLGMLMVSQSRDVYENLALEERLLETWRGPGTLALLYRNGPAVVVGAHQNTHREADEEEMAKRGIALARRVSGGGTVYHDLGNVCFAFVAPGQNSSRLELPVYLRPVLAALAALGVPAQAGARNDIWLGGRKISGTASRMKRDCLLFHGTLLYDADLASLHGVLRSQPGLLQAKGAPSVKSPVVNIRTRHDFGPAEAFLERLAKVLCPEGERYALPAEDRAAVQTLAREKHQGRAWLHGRNPACDFAMTLTDQGGARPVVLHLNGDAVCGASDPALDFLAGTPFEAAALARQLHPRGLSLAIDRGGRGVE